MLDILHIENIAVVKKLDIELSAGMTVLTGETGAGKSIIVDSLNLISGARADKELIRSGESRAEVSAIFSQLDENMESAKEETDLYALANEVKDVLTISASKKNIEINISGESCVINGVRRYLYEIIYNLCDNAIRYNNEGGKVNVDVHKDKNSVVLTVEDNGIGIPFEHQSRIFERFYRVDKSHSKETGGTGLGLSIVKHAVAYHGGTLRLDSTLGKGTTVTVVF